MNRNRWLTACLLPILVTGGVAVPQVVVRKDTAPLPIDATAAAKVIDEALKKLDENYVFPEVAAKMAEAIHRRAAANEYAAVKTGQELAELLTKHLQDVSHDKHLRVRCSTDKLPPRPPMGQGPTAEQKTRMKAMAEKVNAAYRKVERLPGNVGYLEVNGFMDEEQAAGPAAAAMTFLAHTDALILDLRHNGGGSPSGVALLCSYFFGETPVHLNSLYWRKGNRTEEFWTRKDLAGPRYLNKDVYVLTSSHTFSGAEECAYNLQTQKRATIVGETTGGGAHPGGGFPLGEHFVMFIPTGRAINPITKANWEGTGVKPDVPAVADQALEVAHQLALKKLLDGAKDEEARRFIEGDLERARERDKPRPAK
jgi:hypothetical protein